MATSSFYNDNLYRSYPFVKGKDSASLAIPHGFLAGIKVTFNYGGGFASFPSVFLTEWRVENSMSYLKFSCEAEGKTVEKTMTLLPDTPLFSRVVSGAEDMIQIALIAGSIPTEPMLQKNLRLQVEPTCLLWLQHRGIASVRVGNLPRNVLPLPEGIEHEHYGKAEWWWQQKENASIPSSAIVGPLLWSPGFNCRITPRIGNRLQMEAIKGAGLGEVQKDISKGCRAVSDTVVCEEPPADYLRKDGFLDEGSVLYAFCGAVGPHIRMTATSTIQLTAEPEKHTIRIGIGNLGGDAC
jgi:hypothetical protein